jgi:hypothetical protein
MSKKLLSFFLCELNRVRLICGTCGSVIEINIDLLDKGYRPWRCHGCGTDHRPLVNGELRPDAFCDLASAIRRVKEISGVKCEFILEEKPEPANTQPR